MIGYVHHDWQVNAIGGFFLTYKGRIIQEFDTFEEAIQACKRKRGE